MGWIKITRIIAILNHLCANKQITIKEISSLLEIDRKSAQRVLDSMEGMGVILVEEAQRGRGHSTTVTLANDSCVKLKDIQLPQITLTMTEVLALYLLKGTNKIIAGTTLAEDIETVFQKITSLIPANIRNLADKLDNIFVETTQMSKDYSDKIDILDSIATAILLSRMCDIRYNSFSKGKEVSFRIKPLCFFENNDGLYLHFGVTHYTDIWTLAVERILDVTITDELFVYPEGYDPQNILKNAFGVIFDDPVEASIWFSKNSAKYVRERRLAGEYSIDQNDDGSIVLNIKTSGRRDIVHWVLSYGDDAEILAPTNLREEIALLTEKMAGKYCSG